MAAFVVAFLVFVVAPLVAIATVAFGAISAWHAVERFKTRNVVTGTARAEVIAFPGARVAREEKLRKAA